MEIVCQLNHRPVPLFLNRKPMLRSSNSTLETHGVVVNTNLYKVLSLESDKVGFDEIKKAYRNMARRYHPDAVPQSRKEESTRKFVELQHAYETLSDPILRQKYDYEMGMSYLSGCGVKGRRNDQDWRTNFYKEVWEDQLRSLELRVHDRRSRKKKAYM
ncbi:hypothetical protein AQUCO_01400566v1 [Aquilegia coerulea]|uniref:J domain-containing protein n=1 Tax=Aquilegia coerulea TaxID=218851 RepID=A0A2G5DWZ9_AQUCA|nr:hypothetical protein AQUCO_01400566v1 [Aquilegia coerulea]